MVSAWCALASSYSAHLIVALRRPACSEICKAGLTASMTSQVQIEQSLLGWKVSAAGCLHNWAAYGATCLPACHWHPTGSCSLLPHTDLHSDQLSLPYPPPTHLPAGV